MASAVDICNRALSEIGSRTSISGFTDGTTESFYCGLFYDPMRKKLLRSAPWGFARKQVQLSLLFQAATGGVPFPWMFEYLYPPDCIKMRYQLVVPSGWPFPATPGGPPQTGDALVMNYPTTRRYKFLIANDVDTQQNQRKVILSDAANALGVYSCDVTNVDLFDETFKDALSAVLSEKLVIPVTGNREMKGTFFQLAKVIVDEAKAADGNEALPTTSHTPDWIRARGWGFDYYYSGYPQFGPGIWSEGWDSFTWGE